MRGRKFLHPKLGFTFTAPEGFSLDNTAQAVLGIKDAAGNQALRLDVVKVPPEQTLIEYLNSGWIENVEAGSVEELSINGFPAATATAKGDQWTFRLYAIRFGSEVYRFIFAAKTRTAETERTFREAVGTFRRLTLAEIQSAKPLRLKIVKVQPGDTVEHLPPHGPDRPPARPLPGVQRPRRQRPAPARRSREDHRGVIGGLSSRSSGARVARSARKPRPRPLYSNPTEWHGHATAIWVAGRARR